jgi:predicted MPP superfamily phosphohydrolase
MLLIFTLYIIASLLSYRILWILTSRLKKQWRYLVIGGNILLSAFSLSSFLMVMLSGDNYATGEGIMDAMRLNLALFIVLLPRTLLSLLHYTGSLIKIRKRGYIRSFTLTGVVIWALLLSLGTGGFFLGRFNFRYENVDVSIPDLNPSLDGFRIVHISDLHLGSFHGSAKKIKQLADSINTLDADIIVNTGDFITLGHKEFGRFDTLLAPMVSRYGNFAILGNHDIGTYLRVNDEQAVALTTRNVSRMIEASGYTLLNRSNHILNAAGARIAIIGAETRGRHPGIIHPDLEEAIKGTIDADLRILLTHDPNHWDVVVRDYPGIELTLSGHTHGMQMGYLGRSVKWSPSKYFYPRWHGLYTEDEMNLYVNRGLGVLGIPVRIGMPPEITVLTLHSK